MFPGEEKNVFRMVITLVQYRTAFGEWLEKLLAYEPAWLVNETDLTSEQLRSLKDRVSIELVQHAETEGGFFRAVGPAGSIDYGEASGPFHEGARRWRISEWLGQSWERFDPVLTD